jgi:hypothetical protein
VQYNGIIVPAGKIQLVIFAKLFPSKSIRLIIFVLASAVNPENDPDAGAAGVATSPNVLNDVFAIIVEELLMRLNIIKEILRLFLYTKYIDYMLY